MNIWTEDEIESLRKWREEGFTWCEIASRLNRTPGSVKAKGRKLGCCGEPPKQWEERFDKIALEMAGHHTANEIARKLGVSKDTVQKHLSKLGSYPKWRVIRGKRVQYKFWTEDETWEMIRLMETRTIEQTAKILGRSVASVADRYESLPAKFRHKKITVSRLSEMLEVSHEVIADRRDRLGFKFRKRDRKGKLLSTKGASPFEIVKICESILADPGNLQISAKRVRDLISHYRPLL